MVSLFVVGAVVALGALGTLVVAVAIGMGGGDVGHLAALLLPALLLTAAPGIDAWLVYLAQTGLFVLLCLLAQLPRLRLAGGAGRAGSPSSQSLTEKW